MFETLGQANFGLEGSGMKHRGVLGKLSKHFNTNINKTKAKLAVYAISGTK